MANISLRDMPDELYQQIKQIAERERRSLNQQILVLLEQSLRQQKRPPAEVWQQIDEAREVMKARMGIMPDSAELIASDRLNR